MSGEKSKVNVEYSEELVYCERLSSIVGRTSCTFATRLRGPPSMSIAPSSAETDTPPLSSRETGAISLSRTGSSHTINVVITDTINFLKIFFYAKN